MRVATTAVALSVAGGLMFFSLSAQEQPTQPGRGTPPVQQPSPQPGQGSRPSQPPSSPMSAANREVSFTGCVTRATPPGGSGGQQGGEIFLLSHARPATGAGEATESGRSGQTPSSQPSVSSQGAAGMGQQYRLVAQGDSVNLSNHVNHQVRVTGTLMNMGGARSGAMGGQSQAGAPDSSAPGSSQGRPGQSGQGESGQSGQSGRPMGQDMPSASASARTPTLHVTQLTMVSTSCESK